MTKGSVYATASMDAHGVQTFAALLVVQCMVLAVITLLAAAYLRGSRLKRTLGQGFLDLHSGSFRRRLLMRLRDLLVGTHEQIRVSIWVLASAGTVCNLAATPSVVNWIACALSPTACCGMRPAWTLPFVWLFPPCAAALLLLVAPTHKRIVAALCWAVLTSAATCGALSALHIAQPALGPGHVALPRAPPPPHALQPEVTLPSLPSLSRHATTDHMAGHPQGPHQFSPPHLSAPLRAADSSAEAPRVDSPPRENSPPALSSELRRDSPEPRDQGESEQKVKVKERAEAELQAGMEADETAVGLLADAVIWLLLSAYCVWVVWPALCCGSRALPTRKCLRRLWQLVRVSMLVGGLQLSIHLLMRLASRGNGNGSHPPQCYNRTGAEGHPPSHHGHHGPGSPGIAAPDGETLARQSLIFEILLALTLLVTAGALSVRRRAHLSRAVRWGSILHASSDRQASAAAIAALIGHQGPLQVMLQAQRRFRAVRLADLSSSFWRSSTCGTQPACGSSSAAGSSSMETASAGADGRSNIRDSTDDGASAGPSRTAGGQSEMYQCGSTLTESRSGPITSSTRGSGPGANSGACGAVPLQHLQLGECDAFVSHSWSDDSEAKHSVLQAWGRAFEEEMGREERSDIRPLVWIDKACLDQKNIERDLRCLPVFLAGCSRLLVLAGASYPTRLWCALELFTFVYLGRDLRPEWHPAGTVLGAAGQPGRPTPTVFANAQRPISFPRLPSLTGTRRSQTHPRIGNSSELLLGQARPHALRRQNQTALPLFNEPARIEWSLHCVEVLSLGGSAGNREACAHFNALHANCTVPADREKLLAVIEAGVGSVHRFNEIVSRMLTEALAEAA